MQGPDHVVFPTVQALTVITRYVCEMQQYPGVLSSLIQSLTNVDEEYADEFEERR